MASAAGAPRVVVLGAHFGGLAAVTWLRHLAGRRAEICLVSPKPYAVYRPALVHSARGDPSWVRSTRIDLIGFCRRYKVDLIIDYALGIDPKRQRVHLAHRGPLAYDTLFWATGRDDTWSLVPGLGADAGFLCADYAARRLAHRFARFRGGEIALVAGELRQDPALLPALWCACDCALYEWLFLARDRLRAAGLLERTRFVLVTGAESAGEALGARARARLAELLEAAGVEVLTRARAILADPDGLVLETPAGRRRLTPDLAVWMPPSAGSSLARASALDDGWGFVATNGVLQHTAWPQIYALGDLNRATLPKHGHEAMVQARVAVRHWASVTLGAAPGPTFRPQAVTVMHLGGGRALLEVADTLYGGERELVLEGRVPYLLKRAFGLAYRLGRGALPVMP